MRLLNGRLPPTDGVDAFRFPVTPTVMLHAPTKEELIKRIFEFRLRNNLETGDIEADLNKFYCDRFPGFCTSEPRDTDPSKARVSGESMLNRVSRWTAQMVHRMPKGGYALVNAQEAEDRAAICVECRMNVAWKDGCGGCSASTLQLIQQLKSLKRTKRDGNLAACAVTSAENSSAVWIALDSLPISSEQPAQLPVHCWRKTA